jgi:hypothetical protein
MNSARVRTLIFILIFIGGVIVGFFGSRTLQTFREIGEHPPAPPAVAATEAAEPGADVDLIREWMTIPYISRTYDVPQNVLFEALDIPPNRNREKSLRRLNREYFPEQEGIVLEKIKAAVLAARADPSGQQQKNAPISVVSVTPALALYLHV